MPVQSRDLAQVKTLRNHLDQAAALSPGRVRKIRMLARQLEDVAVLPVIGAGASHDCGMLSAAQLSQELYTNYKADPSFKNRPGYLARRKEDLGAVADAICLEREQAELVKSLGLDDRPCWPDVDGIEEHFCSYCVLARLAREGVLSEAVTFDYDCGFEAGLRDEGFQLLPDAFRGRKWRDHATVVADPATNADVERRGSFVLSKVHGCVVSRGTGRTRRITLRNESSSGGASFWTGAATAGRRIFSPTAPAIMSSCSSASPDRTR